MQHSPDNPDPGQERARAVDAAFDHGDPQVGTAVVKLVLSGADLDVAAPRVERALRSESETVRRLGQVAAGDLARLHRRLAPALYGLLRAAGPGSSADGAIKDVLTFVPFRALPGWFRYQSVRLSGSCAYRIAGLGALRRACARNHQSDNWLGRQMGPARRRSPVRRVAMRTFSVEGREYAALIILSDFNEFDAMEVVEFTEGVRGKMLMEFRMTDESCWLESIADGVPIPLLRRAIDVFREEFLEPRWEHGAPTPPW